MKRRLATALIGLLLTLSTPAGAQNAAIIRIGISPIEVSSEPFYAADMGFFGKNGVSADIQMQSNASETIEVLVTGTIDIGSVAINNLEQAYAKGLPLVAIAPASIYDASRVRVVSMLVRNGASIKTAKDFEGKTIGTYPLQSMGTLAMNVWIDNNGGDSTKVKYIEVPFPSTAATLQEGRIDGAVGIEPFATQAKPFAHTIGPDPFSAIAKTWQVNVFVATKAWAAAHPDLVRRFAEAIRDAGQWANNNPDAAIDIFVKNTKADPATVKVSARPIFGDVLRASMIQPTIDLMVRYKQIAAPFKPEDIMYQPPR